jgi:hypothetical protein
MNAEVGDQAGVLYSGNFPFIFQSGDRSHFPQLAGDAYLGGYMGVATMPGEGSGPGHTFTTGRSQVAMHMQRGGGMPFHTLSRI